MALPHYRNSTASIRHWEPVFKAHFEVTIFPPTGVNNALLLQHVKQVSGLDGLQPSLQIAEQKFKQATRSYAGPCPDKTTMDLQLTFTMNLDDNNENYIYTTLRKWCNKMWDPLTGASSMKRDYVGSMIIVQYNKDGSVYRKITCYDAFPTGQLQVGNDLDYTSNEPVDAQLSFRVDYWNEELVGL